MVDIDIKRGGVYGRVSVLARECGIDLDELLKRQAWDLQIEGDSILISKETHSDLPAEEIISVVEEGMIPCGDCLFVLHAEGDLSLFADRFRKFDYVAYERDHGHGDLVIAPVFELERLYRVLKKNVVQ